MNYMMQVGNCVVGTELLEEFFLCNLDSCKGHCCVEGEAGAPLEEDEAELIEKYYPKFKRFLREESIKEVKKVGYSVIDKRDGEPVTPLLKGKIPFRKPISCHLYPIRIKKLSENMDALNYHFWQVCDPARKFGCKKKLKAYKFLKDALIRKYGEDWYEGLLETVEAYKKEMQPSDQVDDCD